MRPPRTALRVGCRGRASWPPPLSPVRRASRRPSRGPAPERPALPTVSVPPLPLPTASVPPVPAPTPSLPGAPTLPTRRRCPVVAAAAAAPATARRRVGRHGRHARLGSTGDRQPGQAAGHDRAARKKAAKRQADATPMIAGTRAAEDLVDDESSPELYRASQSFLAADQGIAEIARQKQVMARLKQDAVETAQLYRAMGYDVAGAERVADRVAPAVRRPRLRRRRPPSAGWFRTARPGPTSGSASSSSGASWSRPTSSASPPATTWRRRRWPTPPPGCATLGRAAVHRAHRDAGRGRQRRRAQPGADRRVGAARCADRGLSEQLAASRRHRAGHRRLRAPARRRDHLTVRHAVPPDPALHQAAHRHGLRRRRRSSARPTTAG